MWVIGHSTFIIFVFERWESTYRKIGRTVLLIGPSQLIKVLRTRRKSELVDCKQHQSSLMNPNLVGLPNNNFNNTYERFGGGDGAAVRFSQLWQRNYKVYNYRTFTHFNNNDELIRVGESHTMKSTKCSFSLNKFVRLKRAHGIHYLKKKKLGMIIKSFAFVSAVNISHYYYRVEDWFQSDSR